MGVKKIISLMLFLVILFASFVVLFGLRDVIPEKADVIVIFGNEVYANGTLSPRLQARMDRAIGLFKQNHASYMIVSGGVGKAGVDEAVAMRDYAASKGVQKDRIVMDSKGYNTRATAINIAAWMHTRNLNSAILVSQYFHLLRSSLLFKQQGIRELGQSYARYAEPRDVYSVAREMIALMQQCVMGPS